MGLQERVLELERLLRPKGINHDWIRTALAQMEECTGPLAPDETLEQLMEEQRNGLQKVSDQN